MHWAEDAQAAAEERNRVVVKHVDGTVYGSATYPTYEAAWNARDLLITAWEKEVSYRKGHILLVIERI